MANSKHAFVRYNILDYCFSNKPFTLNELLSFVNKKIAELYLGECIAIRTLREDKKEGFMAPFPKNIRILRYTDLDFSIAQKLIESYHMVNYYLQNRQQPRLVVLSETTEILYIAIKKMIISSKKI